MFEMFTNSIVTAPPGSKYGLCIVVGIKVG